MDLTIILGLLGGLALFLYGMQMMSDGLETAAGDKMKTILEKLTANRFVAVLVGALITAIIQSSSATTVMVVGFVNAKMMTLRQAVWIIMGANIGTTITGQLIALDVGAIAPLIAFIGVAMIVFFKSDKLDAIGSILAGLGILFIGMDMMSSAMSPLREAPWFVEIVSSFSNPLIGILVGAGFTALIQSSSAAVGILQALAISGAIGINEAIFVLFGTNIGTCVTALLASAGSSTEAKQTTIIHLFFNVIGTTIFTILAIALPLTNWISTISPNNVTAQIANTHTVFNIVTTILLLPFGNVLADFAEKLIPAHEQVKEDFTLKYLDFTLFANDFHIGTTAIANTQLFNETQNMLSVTTDNVKRAFDLLTDFDQGRYERLIKTEEYINYLNKEITRFTTNAIAEEFPLEGGEAIGLFMKIAGDLERIGDHAIAMAYRAKLLYQNNEKFSDEALGEISIMSDLTHSILEELKIISHEELSNIVEKVDIIEDSIDATTNEFTNNQLKRLSNKTCTTEHSVVFTKTLTDFERIGDHGLNIAKSFSKVQNLLNAMKMVKPE